MPLPAHRLKHGRLLRRATTKTNRGALHGNHQTFISGCRGGNHRGSGNFSARRGQKVFADFAPGFTDGIRCDTDGNVWYAWGWGGPDTSGIRVHNPHGDPLGMIHTPEIVFNFVFGGHKRNRLFMAGSTSMYSMYVNAVGAKT